MEQKTCTVCGAEKPATRDFFHSAGKGKLHAKCIICVLKYSRQYAARKSVSKNTDTAKQNWCPLSIQCNGCGLDTPHWFRAGGKMKCQACEAIRRHPDVDRPPFDQYRARLMLVAESKYLRRYCGTNRCQQCGQIHKLEQTPPSWQHICASCKSLRLRNRKRDRSAEYAKRKQQRTENKTPAIKRLVTAIRKAAKAKREKPEKLVCWLWSKPGITAAEKYRIRYSLDEEFRVSERIRRQITKKAKRDGVAELIRGALKRGGASRRAEVLLGYTMGKLKEHLEMQFLPGMCWDNMGDWHIDHITPQAAFDLSDDAQWRSCWSLGNLRPMWAKENIAKGAKQVFLL